MSMEFPDGVPDHEVTSHRVPSIPSRTITAVSAITSYLSRRWPDVLAATGQAACFLILAMWIVSGRLW